MKYVEDYEGMIYLITNTVTGMKYIGKKNFHRYSRRKRIGESNWRTYTGSCRQLNDDIKKLGKDKFKFEVLYLAKSKADLNLAEIEYQVKRNVCRDTDYYNQTLGATKVGFRCKTTKG